MPIEWPGGRRRRLALVTCAEVPQLDADTRLLLDPLLAHGIVAEPVVWDDPAVGWHVFDLAVIRSCWDYVPRRTELIAWARKVPHLANPAQVIEWNTDKRYLRDIDAAGVPIVPTDWLDPREQWRSPDDGEWVIKPTISLAGLDTGRYDMGDFYQRRLAVEHVQRLQHADRTVMIQPYLSGIDTAGETSLVYFNDVLSHTVRKAAVLTGPDEGIDRRFDKDGGSNIQVLKATETERRIAEMVLASAPDGSADLVYARVDLIPGPDGHPVLIELELTEPQLFLGLAPGAPDRMAAAIATSLQRAEEASSTG